MSLYRRKLGKWGEELARKYYERHGYAFVDANWRKRKGEIDLIMEKTDVNPCEIVFIEVKTRTTNLFGYGEEAVTWAKKQKIQKTINQFISFNEKYQKYFPRFDILVVELFSLTPNYVLFENVEL
ncbi:MAG: YraN family protein [Parcubacteria group bacterium]